MRHPQDDGRQRAALHPADDLLHDDYAYIFEAFWDLWTPGEAGQSWSLQPSQVKFLVHGREFERADAEAGDIEIDFGMDTPFLHEELQLAPDDENKLKVNVQKLVQFTVALEKQSGASGRLLRSESGESLAQKLVARLQRVQ